jgi:ketosteroid isomerase-like protein
MDDCMRAYAELQLLNAGFIASVAASDVGWFEQHLRADFLNSNPDGTLVGRAAFLRQVARPFALREFACDDVRIRLFGRTAIVHGRTTYVQPGGERGAGRYTDVWAQEDGRWRCVAADVTGGGHAAVDPARSKQAEELRARAWTVQPSDPALAAEMFAAADRHDGSGPF